MERLTLLIPVDVVHHYVVQDESLIWFSGLAVKLIDKLWTFRKARNPFFSISYWFIQETQSAIGIRYQKQITINSEIMIYKRASARSIVDVSCPNDRSTACKDEQHF